MSGHFFIRSMQSNEIRTFFRYIQRDFSPGEYPPYAVLYQQLQSGIQEGLVLSSYQDGDFAYSICAAGHANKYVLVSLLAVFPECRSKGIGSEFMKLMIERYRSKQALLIEVEKPESSPTPEERNIRSRRISFYERAGFHLVPGIEYSIWGVPMHLMILPLQASREEAEGEIGRAMYQIYLELMGERYIHKMQFRSADYR